MKNWDVWAVHLLTASGAALALAASLAAADNQWQLAFLCWVIALIVDGLDGPLARRRQVIERVPWFDGAMLDFVIDYATYVLVPAIILVRCDLLSQPYGLIAGLVVAVVGAMYFADTRMKTPDAAFRGFPAVWNVVVFQLMIYQWPQWITLLILAVFFGAHLHRRRVHPPDPGEAPANPDPRACAPYGRCWGSSACGPISRHRRGSWWYSRWSMPTSR